MCTDRYNADDLKKPHGSELWCRIRTDPVLRYFANPEGLNYEDLLEGVVLEFVSWLTV
jgi:hypothetical protein